MLMVEVKRRRRREGKVKVSSSIIYTVNALSCKPTSPAIRHCVAQSGKSAEVLWSSLLLPAFLPS